MKPTLLLLPGLMCDAAVWAPQLESLDRVADCVVADYGLCDSITRMAELVLEQTPSEKFAMAGHSLGGRVALEVMRLAPQRVERLALLDTGTHALAAGESGAKERAGRMALLALARSHGMRAMGRQWAHGMVHPSQLESALFDSILDMLERSSCEQFAAQINALLSRPDAGPLLGAIACPTLLLCGREDSWSPPAQHQTMCDQMRHAWLYIIEHCGHMSTLEQPAAVNQALVDWLGR